MEPKLEKITENIGEYGSTLDSPDIVARIFSWKVQESKDEDKKEALGIFTFALPTLTWSNFKNGDSHIFALVVIFE